ncbi:MAG: N-acetyl-gamma-glutamyl-phosphate reductase, partial [Pseudomonadota bacterium]
SGLACDGVRTFAAISTIDNLVKGAAGQAIQNMNLMLGLEETTALNDFGLWP